MTVNFNAMRKTATSNMNTLQRVLEELLEEHDDSLMSYEQEEIIKAYNQAAHSIAMLNCLHDDSVDGDMDDLSDLVVKRLGETE